VNSDYIEHRRLQLSSSEPVAEERIVEPRSAAIRLQPSSVSGLRYNPQRRICMKTRRTALALIAMLLVPLSLAAKEATVTLEVTGMS